MGFLSLAYRGKEEEAQVSFCKLNVFPDQVTLLLDFTFQADTAGPWGSRFCSFSVQNVSLLAAHVPRMEAAISFPHYNGQQYHLTFPNKGPPSRPVSGFRASLRLKLDFFLLSFNSLCLWAAFLHFQLLTHLLHTKQVIRKELLILTTWVLLLDSVDCCQMDYKDKLELINGKAYYGHGSE